MKSFSKLISLLLVLSMCLAFAACGTQQDAAGAPKDTSSPADTTAPSLPSAESTVAPSPTPDVELKPSEEPAESEVPEESEQPAETPEAEPEQPADAPSEPAPTPESNPVPSPESTPEAPEASAVDLMAFYYNITGTYEFAMMGAMDNGLLDAFYPGLTAISMKQSVCMMPMITGVACEVLLVECENEADAATVASIFEARKQSQIDGGAFYPESIVVWERAYVVTHGNFVALFVHPTNSGDMAAMFDRLFA